MLDNETLKSSIRFEFDMIDTIIWSNCVPQYKRTPAHMWNAVLAIMVTATIVSCGSFKSEESSHPESPTISYRDKLPSTDVYTRPEPTTRSSVGSATFSESGPSRTGQLPIVSGRTMASKTNPSSEPSSKVMSKMAEPDSERLSKASVSNNSDNSTEEVIASLALKDRIIVRTADLEVMVRDITETMEMVRGLTRSLGGWVVSTHRTQRYQASISVRIPAESIYVAVDGVKDIVKDIVSEKITSRDITDEFVDTRARLENLRKTEKALSNLLDRAKDVQDALNVQNALREIREEVEQYEGRIKFMQQTSAYSLINIKLVRSPFEMVVDAGMNRSVTLGQEIRFRALFTPPEGIDKFSYVWDFGDASPKVSGDRTSIGSIPTTRITSTIIHTYTDEKDSPYFAEITIVGTGPNGSVEGKGSVMIEVVKSSTMVVDAGPDKSSGIGSPVRFKAFFDVPSEMEDFVFAWDFGDGSDVVFSDRTSPTSVDNRRVTATMEHVYYSEEDSPYFAVVTVNSRGESGTAEGQDTVKVTITRVPTIEVFAGEYINSEEGDVVELRGSFTKPKEVSNVWFRWDFGDGSAPLEGEIPKGVTTAMVRHIYPDFRPFPFEAKLTITADSESGKVEGSSPILVHVFQSKSWVISEWNVSDQVKNAVRTLSMFARLILNLVVWLMIFIPVWLAIGFIALRLWKKRRQSKQSGQIVQDEVHE